MVSDEGGHVTDIGWLSQRLSFAVSVLALASIVLTGCGPSGLATPSVKPLASATATATPAPVPQRAEVSMPSAHEEEGVAALGTNLYVIGGYNTTGTSTAQVSVFDGLKWTAGPQLPDPIDHVAAAVAGGHLYVVGGNLPSGTTDSVYELDGPASGWTKVGTLLRPRAALALVSLSGKLFVVGGYDARGNNLSSVETYDPVSNTATDSSALPFPRNHLAGFAYQGMACAAGGRSGSVTYARVDCYNPTTDHWQQLADLPSATAGDAASSTPSGAVVLGGENAVETQLVSQLFRLVGGTWATETMVRPRHGAGAAVFAGRVWIPGGADVPGRQPSTLCTSVPL